MGMGLVYENEQNDQKESRMNRKKNEENEFNWMTFWRIKAAVYIRFESINPCITKFIKSLS